MTIGEFADKIRAAMEDVPVLRDAKLMKIHVDAVHETDGIINAHLFSRNGVNNYVTAIAYNIWPNDASEDDGWKSTGIRELTDEIEDMAYWVHDYATNMDDGAEREKMAETSGYLHLLKQLIKLCPDEVLNKLQL